MLVLVVFILLLIARGQIHPHDLKHSVQVVKPTLLVEEPTRTEEGKRCYDLYGKNLSFIPEDEVAHHTPAVLLSFPGSGNTWVRLLIEYASGHYTGALDVNDHELQGMLVGERACGMRNSINKAHPGDLFVRGDKLKNGTVVESIRFVYKWQRKKCIRGGVHTWTKFLILSRNPYEAIFADFQRHISGSHAGTMNSSYLDPASPLHKEWLSRAVRASSDLRDGMEDLLHYVMQRYWDVHQARYERLLDRATRTEELRRMLRFLNYTVPTDRLECAFTLADTPRVKRVKKLNITQAYMDVKPDLVCDLWPLLRSFSGNFSYPLWQPKDSKARVRCPR